ncbi:hypothetical protein KIH24_13375 [Rhizobiales bacterium TNE-4]|nr:hypothetical protein [Rhizobiales bacterium TNE-4]MBV1828609.1 hypothetical protein [Rhizobiales bacterium TNE-4]
MALPQRPELEAIEKEKQRLKKIFGVKLSWQRLPRIRAHPKPWKFFIKVLFKRRKPKNC